MNPETIKALAAPFSAKLLGWRVGAVNRDQRQGQALPYIDARDVQNRLDEVAGPAGWKNEFKFSPGGGGVVCAIAIKVGGEWVSKEDGASIDTYANGSETRGMSQKDLAVKGAFSDALKRAAVMWGIGRYLYAFDAPWEALTEDCKAFIDTPKLPASMLPDDESHFASTNEVLAPRAAPAQVATEHAPVRLRAANESTVAAVTAATVASTPAEPTNIAPCPAPPAAPAPPAVSVAPAAPAPPAVSVAPAMSTGHETVTVSVQSAPSTLSADAEWLTDEVVEKLDESIRNYVVQLRRYANEGKNLATLKDALERGKAKDKLATAPRVLAALLSIVNAKLQPELAAA